MPNIETLELPGRWRWNRWAAWTEDDYGRRGPVVLARSEIIARLKALA